MRSSCSAQLLGLAAAAASASSSTPATSLTILATAPSSALIHSTWRGAGWAHGMPCGKVTSQGAAGCHQPQRNHAGVTVQHNNVGR